MTPGAFYLVSPATRTWLWRADFPPIRLPPPARAPPPQAAGPRRAGGRWIGGFTQLVGARPVVSPRPRTDVAAVADYADRIGGLDFAAPQDWMCEPFMIARTGLPVTEHLHRTVENYLTLRHLGPDLPIIPVVQGWRLPDYLACLDLYASAGVDLAGLPRVGLGSVCRRQSTAEIAVIVTELARRGLRLHGFGVKTGGLHLYGHLLTSADSMAWSYAARRLPALPGCTGHKNCANCLAYATWWRAGVLGRYAARGHQASLLDDHAWLPAVPTGWAA